MNHLFGKINLNAEIGDIDLENDHLRNGVLDIEVNRIHVFDFDNLSFFYNDQSKVLCAMIGYISNFDEIKEKHSITADNDVEVIEALYSIRGFSFGDVDGLYTILIFDEKIRKVFVFQDEYGSGLPLYYRGEKDTIYLGTNLKKLLSMSPDNNALNKGAVLDFLYTMRIVPNRETFIDGVFKLLPSQFILVDLENKKSDVLQKSFSVHFNPDLVKEMSLLDSIQTNINGLRKHIVDETTSCALSSGYDTNFILGCLSRIPGNKIRAFTVGGKNINEIPYAVKCAGYYENVLHSGYVVNEDCLNYLPDIVWRYEGYLCQNGIFLSYELAKAVKDSDLPAIFLGENADFVLDSMKNSVSRKLEAKVKTFAKSNVLGFIYYNYVKKYETLEQSKRLAKSFKRPTFISEFNKDFNYILRKSSILMNSFDIVGVYPFINKKTITISDRLGKINSRKRFYKEEVKKFLGPDIANILVKIGGSTDVEYLFQEFNDILSKLLDTDFTKQLFSPNNIDKMKQNPKNYFEMLLSLLYLYVFNELFVTGKYRDSFNASQIDITLSDMMR